MNADNTRKLFKRFSFLNKANMPNGFECGDGWYKLVYDMCKELKAVGPPADFHITHIGERYGGLDVHTKNGVMRTRVVVDEFNTTSIELCHDCGNNRALEKCGTCTEPVIEYPDPEDDNDEEDDNSVTCNSGCVPGSGACSDCP